MSLSSINCILKNIGDNLGWIEMISLGFRFTVHFSLHVLSVACYIFQFVNISCGVGVESRSEKGRY